MALAVNNLQINPIIQKDSEALYSHYKNTELAYNTLSHASVFGYLALVGGIAVVTAISAPVYLPFVTIGALVFSESAIKSYQVFHEHAKNHANLAFEEKDISFKTQRLKNMTSFDFNVNMRKTIPLYMIHQREKIGRLNQLAPILARVQHWEEREKEFEQQALKWASMPTDDPKKLKSNRLKAHQLKEEEYAAKVRAAFYHALLKNPFYQGELENTCSLYMPSFEDRQLALVYEKTDPFLIFNATKEMVSVDTIAKATISEISDRFVKHFPQQP